MFCPFVFSDNEFTLFAPTDDAFLPYRDRILDPNDGVGPSDYQGM